MRREPGPERFILQHIGALIFGLFLWASITGSATVATAQGSPDGNINNQPRKTLDLPSGGGGLDEGEESTEILPLFGREIFANSLYLCVERSARLAGEPAQIIANEFNDLIVRMSSNARFGAVAFNNQIERFEEFPVRALPAVKTSAVSWQSTRVAANGASLTGALDNILLLARSDVEKHKAVVLIVDDRYSTGEPSLLPFLQNRKSYLDDIPIHVFFVGIEGNSGDPELEMACRTISEISRGSFNQLSFPAPPPFFPIPDNIPPCCCVPGGD
jgi:hypothetical protein